jgi:uncharacterized membrane protein YphA (DoxX/SURF4 family)
VTSRVTTTASKPRQILEGQRNRHQPGDERLSSQWATFGPPSPVCTRPSTIPPRRELKTKRRTPLRGNSFHATIVTELAASALILTGIYCWLGALWLAGLTLVVTFVANRFWEMQLPQRFIVENSFFGHLGLVGGFLLVAWFDLRNSR